MAYTPFTISFRTGKDGKLELGARPLYKEEKLRRVYGDPLNIKSDLGSMFADFISLTGDIENSNHPFILVAGDTCEGITENSHFLVRLREYIDLGIVTPNFFKESAFMFFLEMEGISLPAMHFELVKKENCEEKDPEDYVENTKGMSPFEVAMRGFIAAEDEIYEVPYTTYDCETVEDACIASLHFLITHNCNIRKCENCGKYFIAERSDAKYCDRISPYNKNATCKNDGAQRAHRDRTNEGEVDKKIRLKKKAKYQFYYRHQDDADVINEYNSFMTSISEKIKAYKSGAITEKQFLEWLDEQ